MWEQSSDAPHTRGNAEQPKQSEPDPETVDVSSAFEGALEGARSLASECSAQVQAVVELGLLELKLSASALKTAAAFTALLGIGVFVTWLVATAAAASALLWLGLPLPLSLLMCTFGNTLILYWLLRSQRDVLADVGFKRLRTLFEDTCNGPT